MLQIDKSRRVTIPAETLEKAGLQSGEYVTLNVNAQTGYIEIIPLDIKPRTKA